MTRIRYGARSLDELRDREVEATSVGAWATVLTAVYETYPDLIAAVLPPPLEPADEPLARVTVATVDAGRGIPVFGAGTFAVRARHESVVGDYPLVMPMTTEQAVVGGRETFGEPKKLGTVALERIDGRVTGTFARMGITFVEIAGRLVGDALEPVVAGAAGGSRGTGSGGSGSGGDPHLAPRHRTDFYLKFLPAPDGKGFDGPPALVYCHRDAAELCAHSPERRCGVALVPVTADLDQVLAEIHRARESGLGAVPEAPVPVA